MKSYTDLEQSRKLAEFLPLESADMYYTPPLVKGHTAYIPHLKRKFPIDWDIEQAIPCWSLTALFSVLPNACCGIDKGDGKYVASYLVSNECGTYTSDNPIDACVNMIEYLHELGVL